jgi:hypothetical protein
MHQAYVRHTSGIRQAYVSMRRSTFGIGVLENLLSHALEKSCDMRRHQRQRSALHLFVCVCVCVCDVVCV